MVFFVGPFVPTLDPSHIVRGIRNIAARLAARDLVSDAKFPQELTIPRMVFFVGPLVPILDTSHIVRGMRNIAARLAARNLVSDAKIPQKLLRLKLMCCIFLHSSIFFDFS